MFIFMKPTTLLLALFCFAFRLPAQAITFYGGDSATWDGKTLSIVGTVGTSTPYKYLTFTNRSVYRMKIKVHTHSDWDFIVFMDDQGDTGNRITITLSPNSTYRLRVHGYRASGMNGAYNDDLGLDVACLYANGQTQSSGYFEYPVSAYFRSAKASGSSATGFSKPANYNYIEINDLPARWNVSSLPLKVYSNHRRFGYGADYDKVVNRALLIWNNVAESIGLPSGFFQLVEDASQATISMDWSGRYVPRGALGIAKPGEKFVGMLPLQRYNNEGQAAEVLLQEMCHLLGVEHSGVEDDIMHGTAHSHGHELSEVGITDRDRQMLGWLYGLSRYYPFR